MLQTNRAGGGDGLYKPVGVSQCIQGVFTRSHAGRDGGNLQAEQIHITTTNNPLIIALTYTSGFMLGSRLR